MKNELPLVDTQQNIPLQLPFVILREREVSPIYKKPTFRDGEMPINRKCSISPMTESEIEITELPQKCCGREKK